jgi:Flp pilus assembly pilin Flp
VKRWRSLLSSARRQDRGQTAAEYLGVIVVAVSLVVVIIGTGPGLGTQLAGGLEAAICRITGGDCQSSVKPQELPECVTNSYERTIGLSATAFSVKPATTTPIP